MMRFLDDVFIVIGCALILVGVDLVAPVAVWFVAGAMFILGGVAIGMGARDVRRREK